MAGWQDGSPVAATPPVAGGWQSGTPVAPPSDTVPDEVHNLVKNAPGADTAQSPLDAFMAGLHMSASSEVLSGGKPASMNIPADASFANKLWGAVGQGLGDLPFNILGAVGGAAAGSETGPGAAATGGAGAFALPQAVREVMMDSYKARTAGHPMTWAEMSSMMAHSAWNTTKAAAIGMVGGKAGGVAEDLVAGYVAPKIAGTVANATAFTAAATTAQAAVNHHVPDADDLTIASITALGAGVAGHVVAGKFEPTDAGQKVADNAREIYRQTGTPPWAQATVAKADPQLNQELLAHDVNGDPVAPKFNATRAEEPNPFHYEGPFPDNGPEKLDSADLPHGKSPFVVARNMGDGKVKYGKPGDVHFNLMTDEELEGGEHNVNPAEMGFAKPGGPFMSREEAAASIGQAGRLESVQHQMKQAGNGPSPFGQRDVGSFRTSPGAIASEHEQEMADINSAGALAAHVNQLLPQVRGLEASGDDAISPKGAIGRYQIMPGTARQYGFDPSKLTDPVYNEKVARVVLTDLARRFKGDPEAILAAYNAGPSRAFAYLRSGKDPASLPAETQNYLQRGGYGEPPKQPPTPPKPPAGAEGEPPEGQKFNDFTDEMLKSRYQDAVGEQPVKRGPSFADTIRQYVSELEPARAVDRIPVIKAMLDPKADYNAQDMFRLTYSSDDRAQTFFNHNPVDAISLTPYEGTTWTDVLKKISDQGGNLEDYERYQNAARTVQKAGKGIDTGIFEGGVDEANANVKNLKAKYEPAAEVQREFEKGLFKYGRDSGMFNDAQIKRMMDGNLNYTSMRRVMGDNEAFNAGSAARRGFRAYNPLKAMEGSDRQIIKPTIANLDNWRSIIAASDRNRAIGHVTGIEAARDAFGLKRLAAPEVKAMLAEPGSNVFKPYSMTPEEEAAFTPIALRSNKNAWGGNRFIYYNKGVPEVWEAADPAVAALMRGADSPGEADILSKVGQFAAKIQRAGIVASPDFGLRVIGRHSLTTWAADPVHPPPYITILRGLTHVWNKDDLYWDTMSKGGGSGAIMASDHALTGQELMENSGALGKVWNVARHPIEASQKLTELLATSARIGYRKKAEGMGYSAGKATSMARVAFIDQVEKPTGVVANWMARQVPFFQPTVRGTAYVTRQMFGSPQRSMATAAALVLPQLALYALNKRADASLPDNEKYSSLPQWVRDQYYVFPPVNGVRVKLQRAFVLGPLLNIPVERMLESTFEQNPHAYDKLLSSMGGDVLPSAIPQFLRPTLEQMTNHNFFTGDPLIPDSLKDATPDMQYSAATSAVGKKISQAIGTHNGMGVANVSPIVLDNYVSEWGGTMGSTVLHALDKPLGKSEASNKPFWQKLPFVNAFTYMNPGMNTAQVDNFYDDAAKYNALHKDVALEVKAGNVDQALQDKTGVGQKVVLASKVEHALNVMRTALQAVSANDKMTTDEKRQISNRIYDDAWHVSVFGSSVLNDKPYNADAVGALQSKTEDDVKAAVQ